MAEPREIFELLNILTTSTPAGTSHTKDKDENTEKNSFDILLIDRLHTFEETLDCDKYKNFKQEFEKYDLFQENDITSVRWKFAKTCLKALYVLQMSLKHALTEFKKAQELQSGTKELKPSQAPPLSPDTLSIAQQKIVLTTFQFISVLGISPYLHKGVGIPVERKSEFGKVIALTGGESTISELDKRLRLLGCVKVLMACIKCPSLGALILSRNLNDLLASLLQLVYGYQTSQVLSSSSDHNGDAKNQGTSQVLSNSSAHNADVKNQEESCKDKMIGGASNQSTNEITSPSKWTPAMVVDLVRQKQNSSSCQSSEQCDENKLGDNSDDNNIFDKEEMCFCKDSLQEIIDRVYQPMLVRELMILQGGPGPVMAKKGSSVNIQTKPVLQRAPVWLRKICGKLLTDILMKPKGVLNVLRGMLEGEPGTEAARKIMESKTSDWKKCDAVAKVISSCPMKASSVEEYYKMVAPQLIELLHYPDRHVARQFLRVVCSAISNMMSQQPELTLTYLINPLFKPLLLCLECQVTGTEEIVLVQENELVSCIEDIHKVFISGSEPNSSILRSLNQVCHVIFQLYCFIKEGVSHLRSACQEILVTFLKHSDEAEALSCLKCLSLHQDIQTGNAYYPIMHCSVSFGYGSNGGVVVVSKITDSCDTNSNVVVEALLEILVCLKKEGLIGDFFLYMLQELTKIITMKIENEETTVISESVPSEDLLQAEARHTRMLIDVQNQIIILNLLAAICEKIGPSCIKNTQQILNFVQVTLERAVCVCKYAGDELTSAFESETLTMAMGLLTAVLSGAVKVENEDREQMKTLLPLLQVISDNHPDSSVQEMTCDLRIAIATHGTVWSELMKNPVKSGKKEGNRKGDSKPYIEVIEKAPEDPTPTTDLNNQKSSKSEQVSDSSDSSKMSVLQQAFEELCDPLIPVRGHALITLSKLVQNKHPDALEKQEVLLNIFMENLSHPDSYLYLASINGLAGLADIYPDIIIPKLVQEFLGQNSKDGSISRNAETRMKMGEALVKATRNLGDMVTKYKDVLLAATLTGAKDTDPLVRASSMSNLGDICKLLRFSLGGVIHEIFSCCSSLLKTDRDVAVRKAAAMTTCLLLQGLGKDVIKVLDSVIHDLYKLLKFVMTVETDDHVKLHVTLALNELDTIMRDLLFPEQKLQKKIKVLDPD